MSDYFIDRGHYATNRSACSQFFKEILSASDYFRSICCVSLNETMNK